MMNCIFIKTIESHSIFKVKMTVLDTEIGLMAKDYKEGKVEKGQLETKLKEKQKLMLILTNK